jgi:hypothetical protein
VLPLKTCHSAAACELPALLSENALAVSLGVVDVTVALLAGVLFVGVAGGVRPLVVNAVAVE